MTTKRTLRMSKDSILLLSLQHYRYIISWFALLHYERQSNKCEIKLKKKKDKGFH